MAEREARAQHSGRNPGGADPNRPLQAPAPGPQVNDQVDLTDAQSRSMPASGGGFEQACNSPAGVDIDTQLVVDQQVTDHTNDKLKTARVPERLNSPPEALGHVEALLADAGYHHRTNVEQCEAADIDPLIRERRQRDNPQPTERFADDPAAPSDPSPTATRAHRLRTRDGNARYAKRKPTVETVFVIIEHVQGFRQFLLLGLDAVQGEWTLVYIGWNMMRLFALHL